MLKRTIEYTDYFGSKQSETYAFHLSKPELLELEFSEDGGKSKKIQDIVQREDKREMFFVMKQLILSSYGEISEDGKRFTKTPEATKAFEQSLAFEALLMNIATDSTAAEQFITSIVPKDLVEK